MISKMVLEPLDYWNRVILHITLFLDRVPVKGLETGRCIQTSGLYCTFDRTSNIFTLMSYDINAKQKINWQLNMRQYELM